MENANGETIKMKSKCIKCGAIKEIACTVDGNPWCEECFDKAIDAAPIVQCGNCCKYMTPECLLCSFDIDGSCTCGPASDFFCKEGEINHAHFEMAPAASEA